MNIKYLAIGATLLLGACSDGTSSQGYGVENNRWTPRAVAYDFNGGNVQCLKPSESSLKQSSQGTLQYCSWYCAVDNTYDHQWVEIEFILRPNQNWEVNRRLVNEGVCDV